MRGNLRDEWGKGGPALDEVGVGTGGQCSRSRHWVEQIVRWTVPGGDQQKTSSDICKSPEIISRQPVADSPYGGNTAQCPVKKEPPVVPPLPLSLRHDYM